MERRIHFLSVLLALAASAPLYAAQAQQATPAQVAPDYSSTSGVIPWSAIMEKPLGGLAGAADAGSPGQASQVNPAATDAVKGDGKPIHEELSRSNLQDAIKAFNAGEAGAKKPDSDEPAAGSNAQRNPLSPAIKAAKQQANRAEWAKVNQSDGWVDDVLPWAWAVAGLMALGLAFTLWLSYLRAKATRPGMRRRAARKKSHRTSLSSRSSPSEAMAGNAAPDSQRDQRDQRDERKTGSTSRTPPLRQAQGGIARHDPKFKPTQASL